jgi:hypothetical protein
MSSEGHGRVDCSLTSAVRWEVDEAVLARHGWDHGESTYTIAHAFIHFKPHVCPTDAPSALTRYSAALSPSFWRMKPADCCRSVRKAFDRRRPRCCCSPSGRPVCTWVCANEEGAPNRELHAHGPFATRPCGSCRQTHEGPPLDQPPTLKDPVDSGQQLLVGKVPLGLHPAPLAQLGLHLLQPTHHTQELVL